MRAFVFCNAIAVLAIGAALVPACSLGGLDGLSGGLQDEGDSGGRGQPIEAGPVADGDIEGFVPDGSADPSAAYAATVLADKPVAYYRFEDPADANAAKDELGAHPATVTAQGVTFRSSGVRGFGAVFDGGTSLDVGDVFDFAGQVPFALEMWVHPTTATGGGQLVKKRDESGTFAGYVLYLEKGIPHFEGWGVSLSAWNEDPMPAGFTHLVLSVSYVAGKGNATLYINAQPAEHGGFDNDIDLPDTAVHLHLGGGFQGTLDEIAIYDKALPADRILAHYRGGKP
jgi:hypothetical protein